MDTAFWHERTGERGVRKRTRLVRWGARRKGLYQQYLARGLPYFVVTAVSQELLEQEVKPLVEAFMKERGLALSNEKTRITHIEEGSISWVKMYASTKQESSTNC